MRHKPSQITDQVKGTVCSLRTTEDKLDLQLQYISLSEVDFQILVTGRVYCDSFWICRSYFLLLRLCPLTRYHSSLARHRIQCSEAIPKRMLSLLFETCRYAAVFEYFCRNASGLLVKIKICIFELLKKMDVYFFLKTGRYTVVSQSRSYFHFATYY